MEAKACTKCGVVKEFDAFAKNSQSKDGLQHHCRVCLSAANKARREKVNADRALAAAKAQRQAYMKTYNKEYNRTNHAHKLDVTHQWRVRKAGGTVVEEIDRSVLLKEAGGVCQAEKCDRVITLQTMHLDHIVAVKKGGEHSYANTQALCGPCNLAKGSA